MPNACPSVDEFLATQTTPAACLRAYLKDHEGVLRRAFLAMEGDFSVLFDSNLFGENGPSLEMNLFTMENGQMMIWV